MLGLGEYMSVTVHGDVMAAARIDGVVLSKDGGLTWWPMGLPEMLTHIRRVVFSPDGTLWLGAREGVYFSGIWERRGFGLNGFPSAMLTTLSMTLFRIGYW